MTMNETDEKKIEKTSDPDEPEMEAIDEYLSGLEPGFKLVIRRLEPSWCKGFLEEIDITEASDPISLNYLINTWGGQRLMLKFRRPNGTWARYKEVSLYTFEPLVWGQPLKRDTPNPHKPSESSRDFVPSQTQALAPSQPIPPTSTKREMMELLQMLQAMRAADMQAMAAMMRPQQDYPDPYRMMQNAFGLFSQLQASKSPGQTSEDDEVIGLLGKLVDTFGQKKEENAKITPPVSNPSASVSSMSLHEQLSEMEPEAAIRTLQQAVSIMPTEKKTRAMATLLNTIEQIGGTEVLLSQLEQRGIIDGNEESYENSESDTMAHSGGKPGPNARNH